MSLRAINVEDCANLRSGGSGWHLTVSIDGRVNGKSVDIGDSLKVDFYEQAKN